MFQVIEEMEEETVCEEEEAFLPQSGKAAMGVGEDMGDEEDSLGNSDSGMEDASSKNCATSDDAQNVYLPGTMNNIGLKLDLEGDSLGRSGNSGIDAEGNQTVIVDRPPHPPRSDKYESKDTLYSSASELSNGSLLQNPGNMRQTRASMESVVSTDSKRASLDYDVGSSIESLALSKYSKTVHGMSLYDELQLAQELGEIKDGEFVLQQDERCSLDHVDLTSDESMLASASADVTATTVHAIAAQQSEINSNTSITEQLHTIDSTANQNAPSNYAFLNQLAADDCSDAASENTESSSNQPDSTENESTTETETEEVYIIMESYTMGDGSPMAGIPMEQLQYAMQTGMQGLPEGIEVQHVELPAGVDLASSAAAFFSGSSAASSIPHLVDSFPQGAPSMAFTNATSMPNLATGMPPGFPMVNMENMAGGMAQSMGDVPYQVFMFEMPDDEGSENGPKVVELSDSEEGDVRSNRANQSICDASSQNDDDDDQEVMEVSSTRPGSAMRGEFVHPAQYGCELATSATESMLSESFRGSPYPATTSDQPQAKSLEQEAKVNHSIKETVNECLGLGSEDSGSVDQMPLFGEATDEGVIITELTDEELQVLQESAQAHSIPVVSSDKRKSAGDELLHLLNKIDEKAVETRTELKMAYVRESYLQGELEADEEHINSIVEDLNKEIEVLRGENKKFYSEMTQHRTANKAYKLKITKLESVIERLHNHTEELERQIYEANAKEKPKPISITVGCMVDKRYVASQNPSIGIVTDPLPKTGLAPLVMDAYTTACPDLKHTSCMTDPAPVKGQREVCVQVQAPGPLTYDEGLQVGTGTLPTTSSTQTEEDLLPLHSTPYDSPRDPSKSKASSLIDKILQQMSSMNGSGSGSLDDSLRSNASSASGAVEIIDKTELLARKPECPDKWRRLAMTPLTSDPITLQLQRSLATATVEYDLTSAKLSKAEKDGKRKVDELTSRLTKTQDLLRRAKNEAEAALVRASGERGEMDVLQDRVVALERQVSNAQITNQQLQQQISKHNARVLNMVDCGVATDPEPVVKPKDSTDKTKKQQEENEKLKLEIKLLKSEFQNVQKGIELIETLIKGDKNQEALRKHLHKLKALVFSAGIKVGTQPVEQGKSLHENIIHQSQQVLNGLLQNGDLPAEKDVSTIDWTDIQKSIALQLNTEGSEAVSDSEASTPRADDNMPILNRTSRTLPDHVSSLAEAVEKELGMKVNIVIEPAATQSQQSSQPTNTETDVDDIIAQTLGKKYKLDHDKMNKEYEDLRKKRLAMLVQAYTGKKDTDILKNIGTDQSVSLPKKEESPVNANGERQLTEVEKIIVNHLGDQAPPAPVVPTTDTSAIKEKLRQMREQLTKKDWAPHQPELPVQQPPPPAPAPASEPALPKAIQAAEAFITQRDSRRGDKSQHKPSSSLSNSKSRGGSRREIYPHKKGYQSAANFYHTQQQQRSTEWESESVTTTTETTGGEVESVISDSTDQQLSDVSDPRSTSLYQRTYSKGQLPPKRSRTRSRSPGQKPSGARGLGAGTPITRSYQHFSPDGPLEYDPRLSMSMTDIHADMPVMKKSFKDYASTLRGKFTQVADRQRREYEEDQWRRHQQHQYDDYNTDGYYSSKHQRSVSHDSHDPRGGLSDRMDSCGCSHTDLRCSHLDLHAQAQVTKLPSRSPDRPKQENIVGGLPGRESYDHHHHHHQYGGKARVDVQRERLESKDNHRGADRQQAKMQQRDSGSSSAANQYYDNRPPIPSEKDYQELRSEIRRIFSSETRLDTQGQDYDHPNARYRSEDTLYRDVKQTSGVDSSRTASHSLKKDNLENRYNGSASDIRLKDDMLGGRYSSKGPSHERSYSASKVRDYYPSDLHERKVEDTRKDPYSKKPVPGSSILRRDSESMQSSVAGSTMSDVDFLVLGSGDIVKQKSPKPSRKAFKGEVKEDHGWTEPKRRFTPVASSKAWGGDGGYWKEPKQRPVEQEVDRKAAVVDDEWSYEDSEPDTRKQPVKTSSGWYSAKLAPVSESQQQRPPLSRREYTQQWQTTHYPHDAGDDHLSPPRLPAHNDLPASTSIPNNHPPAAAGQWKSNNFSHPATGDDLSTPRLLDANPLPQNGLPAANSSPSPQPPDPAPGKEEHGASERSEQRRQADAIISKYTQEWEQTVREKVRSIEEQEQRSKKEEQEQKIGQEQEQLKVEDIIRKYNTQQTPVQVVQATA